MSEIMEDHASIDASYLVIERIERQKRRLIMIVLGFSLPAMLGLLANSFFFMVYTHQKSASSGINILPVLIIFFICIVLLGLAARKIIILKKLNKKLDQIRELEDIIYKEVLQSRIE
jgi:O-antigen/teichoic acid export membrane protein